MIWILVGVCACVCDCVCGVSVGFALLWLVYCGFLGGFCDLQASCVLVFDTIAGCVV